MKKLLYALVALALSAPAAHADWTGCKLGAFAGISATHTEAELTSPLAPNSAINIDGLSTQGTNGGLAMGCDVQVGGSIVLGAFADYTFQDLDWKAGATLFGNQVADIRAGLENTWAIGARAGYLVTPTTLAYATAGYTEAKAKDISLSVLGTPVGSWSVEDPSGWFVGGGFESLVMKNVSLAIEYRYTHFDTSDVTFTPAPIDLDLDTDVHAVRLALAYRFGAENPLVPTK